MVKTYTNVKFYGSIHFFLEENSKQVVIIIIIKFHFIHFFIFYFSKHFFSKYIDVVLPTEFYICADRFNDMACKCSLVCNVQESWDF